MNTPQGPKYFKDAQERKEYENSCYDMDVYPYCYCCTCCGHDCYDDEPEVDDD